MPLDLGVTPQGLRITTGAPPSPPPGGPPPEPTPTVLATESGETFAAETGELLATGS